MRTLYSALVLSVLAGCTTTRLEPPTTVVSPRISTDIAIASDRPKILRGGVDDEDYLYHGRSDRLEVVILSVGSEVDKAPVPQLPLSKLLAYPFELAHAGISGEVVVRMFIEKDGSVGWARVIRSTHSELEEGVAARLMNAKFSPAEWHDTPSSCTLLCEVRYLLPDQP